MTEPRQTDELTRRYQEASAQDTHRPGAHVRDAVRAHAQAVLDGKAPGQTASSQRPAANQSRWKLSLLASIALVGLTGLLVLQFERGTSEEKELVSGRGPVPAARPSSPASPAPPAPMGSGVAARSPSADSAPASRPDQKNAVAKPDAAPRTAGPGPRVAGNESAPSAPAAAAPAAPALPSVPHLPPTPTPVPPAPRAAAEATAQAAPSGRLADAADAAAESAPLAKSASPPAPAAALRSAPSPAPAPGASPYAAPRAAAPSMQMQEERTLQPQRSRTEAGAPLAAQGAAMNSLHEAARTGRLSQVERLIAQGARINAADEAGRTPLMLAVISGHTAVVQRLLAAGANPALVDREGLNALGHARRLGREEIVRMIEGGS